MNLSILFPKVTENGDENSDILVKLFNQILKNESTIIDWTDCLIIKLPEKGDTRHCINWRGITRDIVLTGEA